MVSFALSKAFETMEDEILFKTTLVNVSDFDLQWFVSYLKDGIQRTSCANFMSDALPVKVGVPQGSILGLLLLIACINDLPEIARTANLMMQFYIVFHHQLS